MDWHFSVQQGMFFDKKIQKSSYVIYASNIIEDGFWNYAFPITNDSIMNILDSIEEDFSAIGRTPCFYLANDENYDKRVEELEKHGYIALSEESVMLYGKNTPEIRIKGNLDVQRVLSKKTAADFVEVFTSAYGGEKTPEQPYGELDKTYIDALVRTFPETQKYFNYVCYDADIPVSIATLCYNNGKGGLYSVGTVPSARGKGCGTVATKACIDKWRDLGGDTLFLQTETGSSVEKWYYKLGFELQFVGRTFIKE